MIMLTQNDLKQIKQIVQPLEEKMVKFEDKMIGLEDKMDNLGDKVITLEDKIDDLALETKVIHEIIKTQSEEHEARIERLEESVGINS